MTRIYRLNNRNFRRLPAMIRAMLAEVERIWPDAKSWEVRAPEAYRAPVRAFVDDREVCHWECHGDATLQKTGWCWKPGVDTYTFRCAPAYRTHAFGINGRV